jgi:hypothetical protein
MCFLSYAESRPKKNEWHEYKTGTVVGGEQQKVGEVKSGEYDLIKVHCMHLWKGHNEIHLKFCKKNKKENEVRR